MGVNGMALRDRPVPGSSWRLSLVNLSTKLETVVISPISQSQKWALYGLGNCGPYG